MATMSNNKSQSTGSSSQSNTVLPPSESTPQSRYSAAVSSISGSSTTTSRNQNRGPSPQFPAYLAQPATQDGSVYGRLLGQPQTPDPYSRTGFYAARAQQNIDRFDQAFGSAQRQ